MPRGTPSALLLGAVLAACAAASWDDAGAPCREACGHLASCHLDGGLELDCGNGCAGLVDYECENCVSISSCDELATNRRGCPCTLRH